MRVFCVDGAASECFVKQLVRRARLIDTSPQSCHTLSRSAHSAPSLAQLLITSHLSYYSATSRRDGHSHSNTALRRT